MPNKNCPQCGEELNYKKGFSKTKNKPYQGYFCPNKACGFVEWIRTGETSPQPTQQPSFQEKLYQTQPTTQDAILEALLTQQKILTEMYKIEVAFYKELITNKKSYGEKSSGDGEGETASGNG